MLEIVILGFLSYTPLSGYDLKQSISNSTRYFWDAKQSQIYRTLKGLEAEGRITSILHPQEDRPDKRIYHITDSGRAMLQELMKEPILQVSYPRDPLLVKFFFSSLTEKEHILTQLRLQRDLMRKDHQFLAHHAREHLDEQKKLTSDNPFLQKTFLIWEQTRLYGERYFEMYIKWLDDTIHLLEIENTDKLGENHGS